MSFPYVLTPRQQQITATAARLADVFAGRAATHDPEGSFPFDNFDDLHRSGFLHLAIPRAYGGGGADVVDMVVGLERLAHGDGSTALVAAMTLSLLGRVVDQQVWPEPILAEVCGALVAHGGTVNTCVTEPELGSISRGGIPATTATRARGGWRINGRKIFVTGAPASRFLVTAAVLPATDAAPQGELAQAIVAADAAGLRMTDTWHDAMSMRSCGNYDVDYQDVFVPDAHVVDRRAIGVPLPPERRPGADGWALTIAAVYLGIGQAACDAAADYANTRSPPSLGQPIAGQPHIQRWIGEMTAALDAARAVLYRAAEAWVMRPDLHAGFGAQIALAKYLCTNAACEATQTALRVAGGFSLTRALVLERHFRDARAGLFQPPQDDLALGLIGRTALDARRAVAMVERSDV
jgi:alkylation response protein AidB-like acyl-CoA dehydrogenase